MKNTVEGFSQRNAVCMGLKSVDLLVLRWLVDFSHSPKMKKKMIGKDVFYWVNYRALLEDLPILDVSKDRLKRGAFDRLVKTGILKHKAIREHGKSGGVFSYYAFGPNYDLLIHDSPHEGKSEDNLQNEAHPYGKNTVTHTSKAPQQRPCSYSNPFAKRITMQQRDENVSLQSANRQECGVTDETADTGHQETELETFDPELKQFVDSVYPSLYQQYMGCEHPHLKTGQRYRALHELSNYMVTHPTVETEDLEVAAEYFLDDPDHGDGSISLFASSPAIITIRLVRAGFDNLIDSGDCDHLHY